MFDGEYNTRIFETGEKKLSFITPAYIPSFSSRDDPYLKDRINVLLEGIPQQVILISAYDYYNLKKDNHITPEFIKKSFKNKLLFLDSGGFELQFSEEDEWNPKKYGEVLSELDPQYYVGYDRIPTYDRISDTISIVEKSIEFFKEFNRNKGRVLLFHFSIKNTPINEIDSIVNIVTENNEFIDIIGFPEREIGANIIQSCLFVKRLKERLDQRGIVKPIHIFGCSDPRSILLLVLSGADIFDGLGWIKYAFDRTLFQSVERTHLPFLKCNCIACNEVEWSNISNGEYEHRLLIHNLHNLEDFFYELRDDMINQKIEKMILKLGLKTIVRNIWRG